MKLKVVIEVEVSKSMAETMERSGFTVCPDGSAMQVKVGNSPAIPKRKTSILFENIKKVSK